MMQAPLSITPAVLTAALSAHFGFDHFRPGQQETIEAVLSGQHAILVMPTGSGKSLCFQLPALLLPGTTIVVSPLIALMKDQVDALHRRNIEATFLNSSLSSDEISYRQARMKQGAYKLVYVAPERFRNPTFMAQLSDSSISMLVVDEAHCMSQWGHDFRPDYLYLQEVVKHLPHVRIMAVTATATQKVCQHIAQLLMPQATPHTLITGFRRENLFLKITQTKNHLQKLQRTLAVIKRFKCGIIYCSTRKMVERVHELLLGEKIPALFYHGALSDSQRIQTQEAFMSQSDAIVVATNAFGMGIDRADIRFVIHWDVPGSIEAYYQEVGRAGRDGGFSWCELLFNYADLFTQDFFIQAANPEERYVMQLFRAVYDAVSEADGESVTLSNEDWSQRSGIKNTLSITTILASLERAKVITQMRQPGSRFSTIKLLIPKPYEEIRKICDAMRLKRLNDQGKLDAIKAYGYTKGCLHDYLISYFGERSIHHQCQLCGNCNPTLGEMPPLRPLSPDQLIVLKKVISCAVRMRGAGTVDTLCAVLMGTSSTHQSLSTYGILSDYTKPALCKIILALHYDGALCGITATQRGIDIALDRVEHLHFAWLR